MILLAEEFFTAVGFQISIDSFHTAKMLLLHQCFLVLDNLATSREGTHLCNFKYLIFFNKGHSGATYFIVIVLDCNVV